VFGGIRFKYIMPTGKSLEEDIDFGIRYCDAIVIANAFNIRNKFMRLSI